jgi:hypothetical protein
MRDFDGTFRLLFVMPIYSVVEKYYPKINYIGAYSIFDRPPMDLREESFKLNGSCRYLKFSMVINKHSVQ